MPLLKLKTAGNQVPLLPLSKVHVIKSIIRNIFNKLNYEKGIGSEGSGKTQ